MLRTRALALYIYIYIYIYIYTQADLGSRINGTRGRGWFFNIFACTVYQTDGTPEANTAQQGGGRVCLPKKLGRKEIESLCKDYRA